MNPQAPHHGLRRAAAAMALVLVLAAAQAVQAAGPGVHGRVFSLDPSGKLAGVVPGAKIEFKSQGGSPLMSVAAAENGYYRVDLPPGHYYFKVTADGHKDEDSGRGLALQLSDGYAVYNFSLTPGETDPERTTPELDTIEEGKLHGRVMERKADGSLIGVPRAQVALRRHGARKLTRVVTRRSGRSAEQAGQYAVSLEAGSWQASVIAPGFDTLVDRRPILIQSDRTTQRDFILTRPEPDTPDEQEIQAQGIKGRISLKGRPAGAQATPQVKVSIVPVSRWSRRPEPLSPGADGGYRRELAVGRYRVTAAAEGYRSAQSGPREVFAGRYTLVNLTLVAKPEDKPPVAKPALDCLVLEQSRHGKRPLPGAAVMVRKSGSSLGQALRQASDRQGQARFELASAGQYTVLAQKSGYKPNGARVEVKAEARNQATIILVQKPSETPGDQPEQNQQEIESQLPVTGYVVYKNPASRTGYSGIAGARLFWQQSGRVGPRNATSGQSGSYRLELREGTYRVSVKPPAGFQPTSEQVAVRRGIKPKYFILKPIRQPDPVQPDQDRPGVEPNDQRVAVRGYVVTRSKDKRTTYKPLPNVVTVWAHGSWSPNSATSSSRGDFTLSLKPTTYSVYVKAPRGYKPKEQKVEVRQGMRPVYLVLDPVATTVPETNTRIPDRLHDLFDRREPGSGTAGSASQGSRKMVALHVRVYERVAQKPTRPIGGALVFVEQNRSRKGSAQTDSKGSASFKLAPGAYRVYVKHQAYGGTYQDVRLSSPVTSRTLYLDKPGGNKPERTDVRRATESLQRVSPIDRGALMRGPLSRKPEPQRQTKPQGSSTQMVIPRTYNRKPESGRQSPPQGSGTQRTSVQTLIRLPVQPNSSSRQSRTPTKPDQEDEAKQPTTVNPALLRQLLKSRQAAARQPEAQPGPY